MFLICLKANMQTIYDEKSYSFLILLYIFVLIDS